MPQHIVHIEGCKGCPVFMRFNGKFK